MSCLASDNGDSVLDMDNDFGSEADSTEAPCVDSDGPVEPIASFAIAVPSSFWLAHSPNCSTFDSLILAGTPNQEMYNGCSTKFLVQPTSQYRASCLANDALGPANDRVRRSHSTARLTAVMPVPGLYKVSSSLNFLGCFQSR